MTDFSDTPNPADTESPMFAPIPAWERNKKRRSFGRSAPSAAAPIAAEQASYAPVDSVTPRLDPAPAASETAFAGTPTYASTTVRRKNTAPLLIGAGIVLIGGLAAAGWYATQPHDQGMAQLTPGAPATTTTTTTGTTLTGTPPNDASPAPAAPSQLAINTVPPPPPAAAARPAARTTTTAATAVARRAPAPRAVSPSAGESGVNTAAVAPAAPARPAFHGLASAPTPTPAPPTSAAPPQAPPVLTPAPTETAPAPAPTPTPPETPPQ